MSDGIFDNMQGHSHVAHDARWDIYDIRFQAWFVLMMSLAALGLGYLMDASSPTKRIFTRNGKYRVALQIDHFRIPAFEAAEPANLIYGVGDTRAAASKDAIRIAGILRRAGIRVIIGPPEKQHVPDFSSFS